MHLRLCYLTMLCAIALFCNGSHAQTQAPKQAATDVAPSQLVNPQQLTRPQIRELVSRLPDNEVRRILLEQLDKVAAPEQPKKSRNLLADIQANGVLLRYRLADIAAATPELPGVLRLVRTQLGETGGLGKALVVLVMLLAAGLVAGWYWRRLVHGRQSRMMSRSVQAGAYSSVAAFGDTFFCLLLELSAVLIFYAVATVLMFAVWYDAERLRQFLSTYIAATGVTLAVLAVAEFCLPRDRPSYRLFPLSDAATRRVKILIAALAIIWTFGFFSCDLLLEYGAAPEPHLLLVILVSAVFIVVLIAMIVSIRGEIAALIRGNPTDSGAWENVRDFLADSWHLLASAYIVLLWALTMGQKLVAEIPEERLNSGLFGLALFFAVPAIDIIMGRFFAAQLGRNSALYSAARRTLRVLLIVGAGMIFFSLWGVTTDRLEAVGIAGWLMGAAVDIGIVALVGYAAWQLVRAYFDSLLEKQRDGSATAGQASQAGGEAGSSGATRTATLIPLLRAFAMASIAVMATLTALSGLGVEIGPLLAGAGVVGIAIGFGAQTLVRDVVSGIFFLVDDAFRTGEYIDVGSVKGTVEKISVRSLRLRHQNGAVHTVPFGEIHTLTNYSRDWVIMKLPLRLTYDTDPQKVKKILQKIGAEMMEDETVAPGLLDAPKSQGVIQMDDSAMILRVKFMSKPGEQFTIRRELLHRIRSAFAEEGINFASREVTVRVTGDDTPETTEKAATAAARTLLDREQELAEAATGSER